MNFKKKRMRYLVYRENNDVLLGEGETLKDIADVVGCSLPMLYKTRDVDNNTFKFKGLVYKIIDKLD